MTTATKLREIDNGRQAEYRFDPPITVTELGMSMKVTHLISSHSVLPGFVDHETLLFPSDGNGGIVSYAELYGERGHVDHDEVVRNFLEENTHEQTPHHTHKPSTHLGTQKPGEQEMSTKIYTAAEVASVGYSKEEIDRDVAYVTQRAYKAAKYGEKSIAHGGDNYLLHQIAKRLRELGYTVQLTQESAGSKYIIVWWDNAHPDKENQ